MIQIISFREIFGVKVKCQSKNGKMLHLLENSGQRWANSPGAI